MDVFYNILDKLNTLVWGMPFVILLVATSMFLSVKLRFNIFDVINGITKNNKVTGKSKRKINNFNSLTSVLAGTLGTGNITGIAVAIITGGVGSLFWMFVSGLFSIVISYVENYIVLLYRKKDRRTGYFGGAMYVLDEVLDKRKLACVFAVTVIISALTSGTMTQANSLSELVNTSIGIPKIATGIILSVITVYVVFGGKRRIAKLSSVVIPICSLTYIGLCISIILKNYIGILAGIKEIISVAFGAKQVIGGVAGLGISKIIGKGFSIGVFSNEAGMGTSPMFTANVEDKDIHKASSVASMSVVIDTLFLCMLTGITIVSTGKYNITNPGKLLNSVFGEVIFGRLLLNICMVFFVLSTIPCLEYYAEQAIGYLTKRRLAVYIFRVLYVLGIYIGSITYASVVWDLSGIFSAFMTLPNLYMIYACIDDVVKDRRGGIKKDV